MTGNAINEVLTMRIGTVGLRQGWNMIGLNWKDDTGNKSVEVSSTSNGRNLISVSSNESVNMSELVFDNGSDSWNWSEAVSEGKVQMYGAWYDSNKNDYNYAGLENKSFEASNINIDHKLRPNRAYWVYVNEDGNITVPGVGGTSEGETYNWSDVRVSNGTVELGLGAAKGRGWVINQSGAPEMIPIQYWDSSVNDYRFVCEEEYPTNPDSRCLTTQFNSWKGYWIWGNGNYTLLIK